MSEHFAESAEVEDVEFAYDVLVALAETWERKHREHVSAAVDAATGGQESVAGLQFAAGSVRALCAEELRAAIGRPLCLCDAPDYGVNGVWCEVHPNSGVEHAIPPDSPIQDGAR